MFRAVRKSFPHNTSHGTASALAKDLPEPPIAIGSFSRLASQNTEYVERNAFWQKINFTSSLQEKKYSLLPFLSLEKQAWFWVFLSISDNSLRQRTALLT